MANEHFQISGYSGLNRVKWKIFLSEDKKVFETVWATTESVARERVRLRTGKDPVGAEIAEKG
jgi:hypothetical protein